MKRLLSLLVSFGILAVIYWRMDFNHLGAVFQNCDPLWLTLSLGMVVPLTLMTAGRLEQLMPIDSRLGFGESNRLILVACVLNLILPSKMGDLIKAWFMKERGHTSANVALALVVFEKTCDMLSLLLWCAFGLLLYPQKDALFWLMTVCVSGGLIVGVLLLGSKWFSEMFSQSPREYHRQNSGLNSIIYKPAGVKCMNVSGNGARA
ncbi:MAG: lysylphosphatidylglycerol synthase transmembrane domain-containing protein [Limisphaerales bacterium]